MAINHVIIHEVKRDEDGGRVDENLRAERNKAYDVICTTGIVNMRTLVASQVPIVR